MTLERHPVTFWIIYFHKTLLTVIVYNTLQYHFCISHQWRLRAIFYARIRKLKFRRNQLSDATGGWCGDNIGIYYRQSQFTTFDEKIVSKKPTGGVRERFSVQDWNFEIHAFWPSSANHWPPIKYSNTFLFRANPVLHDINPEKVIWFTYAKIMLHELCKFYKIQISPFSIWNILRGRIIWHFLGVISCRTGLALNKNMLLYLVGGRCLALESRNAGISIFPSWTENCSRTPPGDFLDRFFAPNAVND